MNLRAIGCNFRTAAVGLREKIAFPPDAQAKAAGELAAKYGAEAVVLSTCNRVELYVGRPPGKEPFTAERAAEYLAAAHALPAADVFPLLYEYTDAAAVRHLLRVASSSTAW